MGLAAFGLMAVACGAVQFAVTLALRPDTRRIATLTSPDDAAGATRRTTLTFEHVGRLLLRRLGGRDTRPESVTPLTARSVGAAAVFAALLLPLGPVVAVLGGFGGWITPRFVSARQSKRRAAALADDLPEVVDLLALALGAGLNVPLAVEAVGRRGTGPLASEMALAAEATQRGQRLADALDDVASRCGDEVQALMSLLASGERYGVPLGESLDRLAVDVRGARRRRAEEVARRLPVKMLFPLVVCVLPAFALLTLGPLLVTSFQDLAW